jgi:hypothetical protein
MLLLTTSKSRGAHHPYKSLYIVLLTAELCEDEEHAWDFQYVELRRFYLTVPRLSRILLRTYLVGRFQSALCIFW